jgi:hypothetical protein
MTLKGRTGRAFPRDPTRFARQQALEYADQLEAVGRSAL